MYMYNWIHITQLSYVLHRKIFNVRLLDHHHSWRKTSITYVKITADLIGSANPYMQKFWCRWGKLVWILSNSNPYVWGIRCHLPQNDLFTHFAGCIIVWTVAKEGFDDTFVKITADLIGSAGSNIIHEEVLL